MPEFANDKQTQKRTREVQLLINLIEPDPEYQPAFVSDEATLLDCLAINESEMLQRLRAYFGSDFDFCLRQPIWKLVDQLKVAYVEWPERHAGLKSDRA